MQLALVPNQSQIQTSLRAFLTAVLSPSVVVVQGQDNRVAEPVGSDFVVMTPIRRARLATNIDDYVDAVFTGSAAADVMTITHVSYGTLAVGSQILGVNVATQTFVTALGTGTGGLGTYTIAPSQTVTSETLAAGVANILQKTEVVFQLDVHGPNSADNAQAIATLMRDAYGVEQFQLSGFDVTPLYADDPRQVPFINDQNQYEDRWIVDAHLQANQTVTVTGQAFADQITIGLIEVDAAYPP